MHGLNNNYIPNLSSPPSSLSHTHTHTHTLMVLIHVCVVPGYSNTSDREKHLLLTTKKMPLLKIWTHKVG